METPNNTITGYMVAIYAFLTIIFLFAVAMAVFSGILQRRRVTARHRQQVEAGKQMLDIYKERHEEAMEAAARQTALLEKILAALERANGREGIKQP